MKPTKRSFGESPGLSRPFENLDALLKQNSVQVAKSPESASPEKPEPIPPKNDQDLFRDAMADVVPLSRGERRVSAARRVYYDPDDMDFDAESMERLKDLVESGKGFVVADTSEYMEGINHRAHPEILERLHRGDFTVQASIDLHGYNVQSAKESFDDFIKDAIASGKRSVLVVHGRGLSSPKKPVLKTKVKEWLTSGPFRKWVLAFSSARSCDGGAGATYVLLRNRPLTKRHRKC